MGALSASSVAPVAPHSEAERVLASHGRSFHWASRLLGATEARRAAVLYHFCRRVDDLVDLRDHAAAAPALARVREDLQRGQSSEPVLQAFLTLSRECDIELDVVQAFLDGLSQDLGAVRIPDCDALVRYGYGVAGTVGLMMCRVLGVRDHEAHPFAIDLGVGMQLTNIARDVLEDAARDRVYLPASLLHGVVSPDSLLRGEPEARAVALRAIDEVLDLADHYYRSADRGMRFLPTRARLGILTAARVYEAIGCKIRREPERYWGRRAVVGRAGKLVRSLRALGAFARPRTWPRGARPVHEARLHRSLQGLPGASPCA